MKKRAFGMSRNMLTLTIPDEEILFDSYLSFLKRGGLFIKSDKSYQLGDEVFLRLTLLEGEIIPVACNVAWINPKGAQGGRPPGIGVHFSDKDEGKVRREIEQILTGKLNREKRTYTM